MLIIPSDANHVLSGQELAKFGLECLLVTMDRPLPFNLTLHLDCGENKMGMGISFLKLTAKKAICLSLGKLIACMQNASLYQHLI